MRDRFYWAHLLAFVSGLVNQELLVRNELFVAKTQSLRLSMANYKTGLDRWFGRFCDDL
jgi:hypothetical protein